MRTIAFLLFCLASAAHSQLNINEVHPTSMKKIIQFELIFIQKCIRNLESNVQDSLMDSADRYQMCIKEVGPLLLDLDCKLYYEKQTVCIRNFADVWKGCIDSSEGYFVVLFMNLIPKESAIICTKDFHDRIKHFLITCEKDIYGSLKNDAMVDCILKLKIFENTAKDVLLDKAQVCGDLQTGRNCLLNHNRSTCAVPKEAFDFVQSLYDRLNSECNSAKTNIGKFIFVVTLLTFLNFFNLVLI